MSSKSKDDASASTTPSYSNQVVDLGTKTYENIKNNIASIPEQLSNTASSFYDQTSSPALPSLGVSSFNNIQDYVSSYVWTSHYGYNGNDHDYYKKLYPFLYNKDTKYNNKYALTESGLGKFMENPLSGYLNGDLDIKTSRSRRQSIRSIMSSLELSQVDPDVEEGDGIAMDNPNVSEASSKPESSDLFGSVSDAEKASKLAEGSILILRDMILDDGVQLNESLRFWNDRWERRK